ncbi:hypothetical protein N657DRAFT_492048 [Parathielavia appendiculata]|uniref:Uncharacterized protein n=1 Tax=Parathielavia appendiculata TaxID=2587402 RepID=A0AAN6Z1I6_9PEZI|nr:hypothetical protein N657DRAFT_492048 [Parathielavia appendiculata]
MHTFPPALLLPLLLLSLFSLGSRSIWHGVRKGLHNMRGSFLGSIQRPPGVQMAGLKEVHTYVIITNNGLRSWVL